jgi:pimeloyl-ACP methyl ester carboxylesterase
VNPNAVAMGEGPPVVLIHGLLLGSLAQWYFTLAPALAIDHRVVLYDLRGHGRSPFAATGFDLATLARDLDEVLALQGVRGPVDVVGHSYGGLVALASALSRPDRVRRLVLVDVPLPPSDAAALAGARGASPEALLAMLPEEVRGVVLGGGRRARRLVERIARLVHDSTLLADLAAEPDLDDGALARLEHPALCLVGASSRCRPAMDRLARVLPGASLQVLPGGHFLPVEAPSELAEAVVAFLRS